MSGRCSCGLAILIFGGVLLPGCVDGSLVQVEGLGIPTGTRYSAVSGDQQEGIAGEELPEPLVVRVTDSADVPVEGQVVNWVVTEGGGTVYASTGITNAEGLAADYWTLGPEPGTNRLEVRAVDSTTGEALIFARFEALGTDGSVEPSPPPVSISLSGFGYKEKGRHRIELTWSGAATDQVEIRRNAAAVATTSNDGSYLDALDARGGATYSYRVCETDGGACSAEVYVHF